MSPSKTSDDELNAIQNIDKIIHEPARLLLMAHLFVVESADFLFLQRQTGLTWGNISSHLRKLENAGYVTVQKEFIDKKTPHNTVTHRRRTSRLQRIQKEHEAGVRGPARIASPHLSFSIVCSANQLSIRFCHSGQEAFLRGL
jgi:DNA-binding transcriptional ArsR family regulator